MESIQIKSDDIEAFISNILYKPLFVEASIGILFVDWGKDKGRILGANEAIEEMLGYSRSELLKKRFQDFTHRDDIDVDEEQTDQIQKFSMIKRYLTKNDKVLWVRLTANPVFDKNNNFLFYLSWVEKLPNGGHFKLEQNEQGEVCIRPQIKISNFLADNWRIIMIIALFLMGYIEKGLLITIVTKILM
jgi:PAS domain S-box-containing protein